MDSSSSRSVPGDGSEGHRNGNVPSMPLARSDLPGSTGRSEAGKGLPDDRLTVDMQVATLRTFARSSAGREPVTCAQVAGARHLSADAAALSSGFFVASGWLEYVGADRYVATDAAVAYHRLTEAGDRPAGVAVLADPARSSWYWQALAPSLTGPLSRYDAVVVLATHADTAHDEPRLERLLQWLEFLEMIRTEGDHVVGSRAAGGSDDPVLTFSTELHLTGDDLARLNPDQIRALFEAVGTVASLMHRRP